MQYDIIQVLSMLIMGVAAATGIRLLVDPTYVAWLGWLPSFGARLTVTGILLLIGIGLTAWAYDRAKALGRR